MMTEGRPFAVFDIDGTLIRWQMYHAIVDRLAVAGHIPAESYERARDARMRWKHRAGEESFREYEEELVSAYRSALTTLRVEDFQKAAQDTFDEHKDQVYRYTRDLIRELKSKGFLLFAISASQAEIVEMVGRYYGFDDFAGTFYEQEDGHFTGKIELILHRKTQSLKRLIAKHHALRLGSIGVGDSEGDIAMLEEVDRPIAFNPSKKLFHHAQAAGWDIVVERKNMIYELEPKDGRYVLAQADKR
jgi:HAD superfamily hydrolase (TIGR01490 family)